MQDKPPIAEGKHTMSVPERRLNGFFEKGSNYRDTLKKFGGNKQHVGVGF